MNETQNGEAPLDPQLRERLRAVVAAENPPPELEKRVREGIAANPPSQAWSFWMWQAGVAALLLLCLGSAAAYRRGYLRFTPTSRNAYIDSISRPVAAVMRPGLGDHMNCAYFGEHPAVAPSDHEFAVLLGPGYRDLLWVAGERVRADYRLIAAHHCGFRGRRFVHLTFRRGHSMLSLVISDRENGESMERDHLIPALTEEGLPMYQEQAQRFEIAAFETPKHLVYVVSDLSASDNLAVLTRLAGQVLSVLRPVESSRTSPWASENAWDRIEAPYFLRALNLRPRLNSVPSDY